ncbi:phosphoribosylamine--glycine ligase [Clostridia bacterium]|nr:phosphoribosylamine--glycine ligase [Clostridia bacterium]
MQDKTTVMVIGSGGREHAVVRKLRESPYVGQIYILPGNVGIKLDQACAPVECLPIAATAFDEISTFAKQHEVGFAVITPDDPLCLGLTDRLESIGIPSFGPSKSAARIEGSKSFAKELMTRRHIPTASYQVFDDMERALDYVRKSPLPVVIKADGLALGKGVVVAETLEEAEAAIKECMLDRRFGEAGQRIVVEEYLKGVEASLLLFTDGDAYRLMPAAMDHKRAFDGDVGPNTGGMGTITPHPLITPEMRNEIERTIIKPTLAAMRDEGCPFKGCLFIGLMLTNAGPKVIEYNCRFGDPEAQSILALLESDLFEIMKAVRSGTLAQADVRFKGSAASCVVAASGGYPGSYTKGVSINGLQQYLCASEMNNYSPKVWIDCAGVGEVRGEVVTTGGRVFGITATGSTINEALREAYTALTTISFDGMQYRTDIGAKVLEVMNG